MENRRKNCNCAFNTWGNSVLALNIYHWRCDYCSKEIKNGKAFEVFKFGNRIHPYIICSEPCYVFHVRKLEAQQSDGD